ncbi:hypothetical protein COBT_001662 [Conglomerata obtusa]
MNFANFVTANDTKTADNEVIFREKPKPVERKLKTNDSVLFDQNLQAHTDELRQKTTLFLGESRRNAEDPCPYLRILLSLCSTAETYIKNNENIIEDNKNKIISMHADSFRRLFVHMNSREFGQSKNIVQKLLHIYMIENRLALCDNSYDELLQGINKFNNDIRNLIDEIKKLQSFNYAKRTTNQSKQEEDKCNILKSNCESSGTDNRINGGHNGNVFYITNAYFNNTLTDAPNPKVYFKNNKN